MKRNIDLTENFDFRLRVVNSVNIKERQKPMDRFPSFHKEETFIGHYNIDIDNDTGAIRQGNGIERKEKAWIDEFTRGNFCDCCGRKLFPYYNSTLCPKCDDDTPYLLGI